MSNNIINTLVSNLENTKRKLLKLEEDNSSLFKEYHALKTELSSLEEVIKTEARKFVLPLGKVNVANTSIVKIDVTAVKTPYSYVWAKAVAAWDPDVLGRTRVYAIDNEKVEQEIKLGFLSRGTADIAKEAGSQPTPRVEIAYQKPAKAT